MNRFTWKWCFWAIGGCLLAGGCLRSADQEVVVYAALDAEFSEPILQQFTKETGIVVRAKFDVESTKTVGLTNALIAEADKPRCDVFWNNEILNTLRLEQRGLLEPYDAPGRQRFSEAFYANDRTWYGFAARARILIVNTQQLAAEERPQSVMELADPKWKGRVAIAKPLFGTTASHATVLFHKLGEAAAREFFLKARDHVEVLSGNKQVAMAVARGQFDWGVTDTDDATNPLSLWRPAFAAVAGAMPALWCADRWRASHDRWLVVPGIDCGGHVCRFGRLRLVVSSALMTNR